MDAMGAHTHFIPKVYGMCTVCQPAVYVCQPGLRGGLWAGRDGCVGVRLGARLVFLFRRGV